MIYFSTLLIAMFITIAATPMIKSAALRIGIVDLPGKRKIHSHPMPKSGGISMTIGIWIPMLFWSEFDPLMKSIMLGSGIVVFFGAIDDAIDLSYKVKFCAQIVAALVVILYGGVMIKNIGMLLPHGMLLPNYLAIPLTLIFIVGATNAVNLSDGLDGLAGGLSLLGFFAVGFLAYSCFAHNITLLASAMVGAILGFLRFNTHPATIFMGDAGSQLLGFLIAVLGIALTQANPVLGQITPLLLIGFSVLDTLTVMLERIINKRSPFLADKNHFHHKLIRIGFYQSEAVTIIYMLQALLVCSAIFFRYYSERHLLIFYAVFSCLILVFFGITDRTGWQMQRKSSFDINIKKSLKPIKEKVIEFRFPFKFFSAGLPLLLLFIGCMPAIIPLNLSIFASALAGIIFIAWLTDSRWEESVLRLSLFLIIPILIFQSENNKAIWINSSIELVYNGYLISLFVFMLLTIWFSKCEKKFKPTPLDFLIIFIAILTPNLPVPLIDGKGMGMLTSKILFLLFGYEILLGEIRKKGLDILSLATAATLGVVGLRGIL